jgi:hypothetical protein
VAVADATDDRESGWGRRIELFSVLLIALTAVLTAWSGFEASKWGGVMSIRFAEAGAARTESVRAANLANRQTTVDVGLFTAYAQAVGQEDDQLATFLEDRFPDRLAVAADAWLATRPLRTPGAPATPFDMPEYVSEANERAERLERDADELADRARDANQRGDNYTITTIFLATVLLLAALSTKVASVQLQRSILGVAMVVFVATGVVIATFPVEI